MMPPHVSFDLDGTLVDTRDAVRRSYRIAGVEMPDYAFGLPWQEWLPQLVDDTLEATQIHQTKTSIYLDILNSDGPPPFKILPATLIARKLLSDRENRLHSIGVSVITAATSVATLRILDLIGLKPSITCSNVTLLERLKHLDTYPSGTVYVDDNCETVNQARCWTAHIRSILYKGQSYFDLLHSIMKEE